jgi:predicted N-acetyltransferase YhbS
MSLQLNAPQPLATTHILDRFECGEVGLDEWIKRRAMTNQMSEASRTFVVADHDNRVYGFYAMAAGAVSHQMATSSVRRNMPVPVMVLARLAVDHQAQGIKLGASLLQDAVNRAVAVSQNACVRALLVHTLNDRAKEF